MNQTKQATTQNLEKEREKKKTHYVGIQPVLRNEHSIFRIFGILRIGHKEKKRGNKDRRLGSLEPVQTVWITYVVVVIWADKMLLERSFSSPLFALGSQAEIYYGWKPLQLSDVSAGLRELKISAEINSMSCDFEYLQQLRWEKKSQRL